MQYLVVTFVFYFQFTFINTDYYWKDYHGKIPVDAFKAGEDINYEDVYIGQVFLRKNGHSGLIPTAIYKRKKIVAQLFGVLEAKSYVQILCSNSPENFEWMQANNTHLHTIKTSNDLVRGGIEDDHWLNIGRVKYRGEAVIGKILSEDVGNAVMYFAHEDADKQVSTYDILTYNNMENIVQSRITAE